MGRKKNSERRIAIIDADLIGRDGHRFPNLVCEKISGYWKEKGSKSVFCRQGHWTNKAGLL